MDNRTEKALSDLLNSKKYSDICPDTVKNAFLEQTKRHGKLKDADIFFGSQCWQVAPI